MAADDTTDTTDTAPDPAADPAAGPAGGPTLAGLDEKVDRLAGAVERLLGRAHEGSQDAVQARLDGPGSVADTVREELARAAREKQAADLQAQVASTAQTVAQLAEQTPAPPLRRVTRVMFGPADR